MVATTRLIAAHSASDDDELLAATESFHLAESRDHLLVPDERAMNGASIGDLDRPLRRNRSVGRHLPA